MSALDKAKAHYREVVSGGLQGPISVPEWDLEIYYKPSANFHEQGQILELMNAGKVAEGLVTALILRARDADGKLLFKKADKTTLIREVDANVIANIIKAMSEDEAATSEALGN